MNDRQQDGKKGERDNMQYGLDQDKPMQMSVQTSTEDIRWFPKHVNDCAAGWKREEQVGEGRFVVEEPGRNWSKRVR